MLDRAGIMSIIKPCVLKSQSTTSVLRHGFALDNTIR
jgi:hypothetical protein